MSSAVGKLLRKNKKTLALAESCTGGLVSHLITETPGSSGYFLGSVVSYDNAVKTAKLGLNPGMIRKKGAVSEEAAKAMAKNVKEILGSDFGIGITGIAGPGGGSRKKPVGLVYIAIASKGGTHSQKFRFFGTRTEIKSRAAQKSLDLLRLKLLATSQT